MKPEVAVVLLESLIQRIERNPETGGLRLSGPLSTMEFEALGSALSALGGAPPAEPKSAAPANVVPRELAKALVTDSLKREAVDGDGLLCLDFGTAMSKAAATIGEKMTALGLGLEAGDEQNPFGLHSSVFIAASGRVHFGHHALAKSLSELDANRRRMDSLKQQLSQGSHDIFLNGRPAADVNPTRVPLTNADLVLAYLAYLTDIATSAFEKVGGSRYSKRRFARPCWESEPERLAWAEGELRRMLAKAQVLADTFKSQWSEGIPADVLKATIDSLNELQQLPEYLIERGLQEPVAAAASRVVSEDERDRGMFVVVDVGAGTTDFAVFWVDQDNRIERFRIWLVDRSVSAISLAGDSIDDKLRDAILEKAHLRPGGTDYPFAATRLSRDIRRLKEQLVSNGSIDVQLPNGQQIAIAKADFEASQAMKEIEQAIKDKFMSALRATDPSWAQKLGTFRKFGRDEISVVLTGGGAGLAMIQALARGAVEVHGINLGLKKAEDVPEWITVNYPTYVPVYQRLAVAIGGSSSDVPELAPNPGHFNVGAENAQWEVKTTYKV